MKIEASPMMTIAKITNKTPVQLQQPDHLELPDSQWVRFLPEVVDSLQDGLLLFQETGELIHANKSAHQIFDQMNQHSSNSNFIPPAILRLFKSLLDTSLLAHKDTILFNEIIVDKSIIFRVRSRWLDLEQSHSSYLLVIIENRYESLKNIALTEAQKYKLTPREIDIWCLYRAKLSYKDIATQLYITLNTVKKHMKNIHAKRQAFLNCEN